ncbi:MAG TPA: hypothetical protein VK607_09820, partial [Kofleriaceae bacterium]|nr:hypothetical protein [Kofleriaceae bacterium]
PPLAQSINYSVQQIVRRALEKDPSRRYQSSGEMMQHCQQVFAEVTQGGMSIGPGGMPKTMIAGGGQGPPGMQQQPQQMMQPPGMQQHGGMPQGGMPQGQPQGQQPGGYNAASPAQKTIMAGVSPMMGGQMMQPGQMQPGYPQMQQMQQMPQGGPQSSGPNKTVMLQASEGVVSVARTGQAVQPAGTGMIQQGASTLFWIVSLVIGVAVGALAYVIVLQL